MKSGRPGASKRRPALREKQEGIPFYFFKGFEKQMRDYWGQNIARPIPIRAVRERLSELTYSTDDGKELLSILEKMAQIPDGRVSKITVELVQEGVFQWVFRLTIAGMGKKKTVGMTVAKSAAFSRTARREFELITVLNRRNGDSVVKPLGAWTLPLTQTRSGRNVELFVYWAEWLYGFYEVGMDSAHKFALIGFTAVETLSVQQTEAIKGEILRILASLYEPESGSALVDLEVNSGDFMAKIVEGKAVLKLIAARRIRTGLSVAGLVRNLLSSKGLHADRPAYLHPRKVDRAAEKLTEGLSLPLGGVNEARRALRKGVLWAIGKGEPAPSPYFTWENLLDRFQLT